MEDMDCCSRILASDIAQPDSRAFEKDSAVDDELLDDCWLRAAVAAASSIRAGKQLRICMMFLLSQVPDDAEKPAGMVERSFGMTLCLSSDRSMASRSARRPSLAYCDNCISTSSRS